MRPGMPLVGSGVGPQPLICPGSETLLYPEEQNPDSSCATFRTGLGTFVKRSTAQFG